VILPRRVAGKEAGSELGSSPHRWSQLQAWPQTTPTPANIQKQLLRRFDVVVSVSVDALVTAPLVVAVELMVVLVLADIAAGSSRAEFYVFFRGWPTGTLALGVRDFFTRKQVRNSMGEGIFWRLSSELELDLWLSERRLLHFILPLAPGPVSRAWR